MKLTLVIFAAILCVKAPGLQNAAGDDGCNGMSGKKVYLIADNGKRLARCNNCGVAAYANSVSVHGNDGDTFAMWTLESAGQNKCALKADSGNYAARCNNCWARAAYPDSLFAHLSNSEPPYAQWEMEKHGEYFSFKGDNGNYITRCNSCVYGRTKPNFAFVHFNELETYSLWKLVEV